MSAIASIFLQSWLYATATQQPFITPITGVEQSPPREPQQLLIAAPNNFNPQRNGGDSPPSPAPTQPVPPVENTLPSPSPIVTPPVVTPTPPQPEPSPLPQLPPTPPSPQPSTLPQLPPTSSTPVVTPPANSPPRLTLEADKIAAQRAWQYFERNWNAKTGLVNSGDNYAWTTLWDQGSAILGIHAAYQLGIIPRERFARMSNQFLQTLETLPLPATGLPNKAYSTATAQMRKLNDTPDPKGTTGWSALDLARLLVGLHVLRTHYPEYSDRINRIVSRWDLSRLVKNGELHGGVPGTNGQIRVVQEGRFGYEQYAAYSLLLWNIKAANSLYNPPVKTIQIYGIPLQVDTRNLKNSGASNYLTNDPYVLWGLEIGWPDAIKPQVQNLLKVQAQRFQRTGILTAVNEDSLNRPPYFLYYSVYAEGQPWYAINVRGKAYPQLRFASTKAAFSWEALMPNDAYAKKLRTSFQNLANPNRGYYSGRYENAKLGINSSIDVNTNGSILESLLYKARSGRPLTSL